MKFVPVKEQIMPKTEVRSENQKVLIEFMESEHNCVEVVDFPQKNAHTCVSSLKTTAESLRLYGVIITRRHNRVFLIRKEI